MTELSLLVLLAGIVVSVWYGLHLLHVVKADGYGFRSSSGLPKDWAPPELPSTPYSAKPHF